ncbi:MAG: hypothetical protein PVJ46_10055 [Methyloceanibacter sp.]
MTDSLDHKSRGALKNRGVIAYMPRRSIGVFSFLLTGAVFAAALILTLSRGPW